MLIDMPDEICAGYKNLLMDPTEVLRERVSKYMCGKYRLPAMVLNHGKSATIVCCCREFEKELRAELTKNPDPETKNLRITFISGSVEFV